MKKYLLLCTLFTFASTVFGQSPQKFKFQAVARDAGGALCASVNLGVRVSLVRDGVSGLIDYSERHQVTTWFSTSKLAAASLYRAPFQMPTAHPIT